MVKEDLFEFIVNQYGEELFGYVAAEVICAIVEDENNDIRNMTDMDIHCAMNSFVEDKLIPYIMEMMDNRIVREKMIKDIRRYGVE